MLLFVKEGIKGMLRMMSEDVTMQEALYAGRSPLFSRFDRKMDEKSDCVHHGWRQAAA
jgi:hypothetical protein